MDFSFSIIKQTFVDSSSAYWDYFIYQLQHPAWDNPFYIILCIYLLTFSIEVIFPKKENYPLIGRKGFKLDLLYLVFIDFVISAIGFYAITSVVEYLFLAAMGKVGLSVPIVNLDVLPVIVQFIIFFIVADFVQFFGHYMMHRSDFFWEFHKIHHAQEQLGFASTRHFHWMEYLVLKPLLWIPFGLLGYSAKYYVIFYLWIGYFFVFLSHCNVKINWGILKYIFITPDTHYWHHSRNVPKRYGVNFASVLNVWDWLFGTFYLPKDEKLKPHLGVHDQKEIPDTFMGQMIYPFKKTFGKKPAKVVPQLSVNTTITTTQKIVEKKAKQWKKKKR
jgi:sterol desaturase/sphingolipid hydroxylase (fatty acid hydroxylase superfamily)